MNKEMIQEFAERNDLDVVTLTESVEDTMKVLENILLEGNIHLTEELVKQALIIGHQTRMKHYQDIIENKDGIKDKLMEEVYNLLISGSH